MLVWAAVLKALNSVVSGAGPTGTQQTPPPPTPPCPSHTPTPALPQHHNTADGERKVCARWWSAIPCGAQ